MAKVTDFYNVWFKLGVVHTPYATFHFFVITSCEIPPYGRENIECWGEIFVVYQIQDISLWISRWNIPRISKEGNEIPRGPAGGMYDAKFEPHIILTQLRVRGGTFLLHAQIRPFCSRTMNLPNKTYWTSFCQFDTISGIARLFSVSLPHWVNLCHWRLKVVSRVRTRERYAHRFYRFCLLFLHLWFIPGEVRT